MTESVAAKMFASLPSADSVFLYLVLGSTISFLCIEFGWVLRSYWAPKPVRIPKNHVDIFWSILPMLVLIFLMKAVLIK